MLAFISSNKWFRAAYGANLRKLMAEQTQVRSITDFGELPVFLTAATFPMIFVAQKSPSERASGALERTSHPRNGRIAPWSGRTAPKNRPPALRRGRPAPMGERIPPRRERAIPRKE